MSEVVACVFGSRRITQVATVEDALVEGAAALRFARIVRGMSGMADGPDLIFYRMCVARGIPCAECPALWDWLDAPGAIIRRRRDGSLYNLKAGYDRNTKMAEDLADMIQRGIPAVALGVWDGKSGGTDHMVGECERLDVPLYVHRV